MTIEFLQIRRDFLSPVLSNLTHTHATSLVEVVFINIFLHLPFVAGSGADKHLLAQARAVVHSNDAMRGFPESEPIFGIN